MMKKENDKYKKAYDMVVEYEKIIHQKNQKRISVGLKCIVIIPLIFLVLLFWTDSSKIIFLILWIVSLFAIAVYLITVEYMDYNLMERMARLDGNDNMEEYSLIDTELLDSKIKDVMEKIENEGSGAAEDEEHH